MNTTLWVLQGGGGLLRTVVPCRIVESRGRPTNREELLRMQPPSSGLSTTAGATAFGGRLKCHSTLGRYWVSPHWQF